MNDPYISYVSSVFPLSQSVRYIYIFCIYLYIFLIYLYIFIRKEKYLLHKFTIILFIIIATNVIIAPLKI